MNRAPFHAIAGTLAVLIGGHVLLNQSAGAAPPGSPSGTGRGNGYPEFSWDKVALYAHLGIGDGLDPDQCKFLGDHFDLIAFTGGTVRDGASVEPKMAAAARAIKQRNPKAKVLFYWASDMPKPQWKISNSTFPKDGFLIGEIPRAKGRKEVRKNFDVTRQDVRDWWTDVAARAVREYSCDGIFIDGAIAGMTDGPWSRQFGKDKATVMDRASLTMFTEARKKMGENALLIFNGLQIPEKDRYLAVTDGAMIDDWDRAANIRPQHDKEHMANTISAMQQAAREGRIVVFKGWPGFTWWSDKEMMKKPHEEIVRVASKNITFPLASFLVGAGRYSYFCYTWGWLGEYGTFDRYPEFDKPLGAPKGEAVREGWTYRRDFEHASVFVDLETKDARIDWH